MQRLLQDVRYALRMLRANPGFTAVAILTLALGIGANTAIFSLTDQVLLRTLPIQRPEELVVLHAPGSNPGHTWSDGDDSGMFSFPMYKDLLEHNSVFSGLLARYPESISVAAKGQTAERSNGELVSGNYFDVLGVTPALGRVFRPEDETAAGANPVAVLTYGYWTRRFGGDTGILNKELIVNGTALTVVGVTRAGFTGIQVGQVPDVFIPITMKAQMTPNWDGLAARDDHWVAILGRLKPGYTPAKAEAALAPAFRAILESELPILKLSAKTGQKYVAKRLKLDSGARGRQIFQSDAQKPLVSLMIMVGLVLLIACVEARARRKPVEVGETTSHGKSVARAGRRRRRNVPGVMDARRAGGFAPAEHRGHGINGAARLSRACFRFRAIDSDRSAVWIRAGGALEPG
jgi:putative ABC transport system permease protein